MAEINVLHDGDGDVKDCFRNLSLSSVVHYINKFLKFLYGMSMLGNIVTTLGDLMTTMGIVFDGCGIV